MAYEQEVANASAQYGVDANLIQAVIAQESSGNVNATSSAGAMGLMQLMPSTFASMDVGTNAYDAQTNINAGTKYLSQLLSQAGGDVETALASYYAGSGNVAKYGKEKYASYYNGVLSKYSSGDSSSSIADSIIAGATMGAVDLTTSSNDTLTGALLGATGTTATGQTSLATVGASLLKIFSVVILVIFAVVFFSMAVLDKNPVEDVSKTIVKAVT